MLRFLDNSVFILGSLIGSILTASILLYFNMNKIVKFGTNPIIGEITVLKNTARRKFDSQVVWDSLKEKTKITNGDTILTEADSNTVVTLKDGTKIELKPSSMVYLNFSDNSINVDFAYGSIAASKADAPQGSTQASFLQIKSGDMAVQLGEGGLKLEKTSENKINLEVDKGSAKIIQDGQEKLVNKDEKTEVSLNTDSKNQFKLTRNMDNPVEKKVEEKATPLSNPVPIFPANGQTINMDEKEVLGFKWQVPQGADSVRIEVFHKKNTGDDLIFSDDTSSNSVTISDMSILDEGDFSYTLTATAASKSGAVSQSSPVTVNFKISAGASKKPKVLTPKKVYVE